MSDARECEGWFCRLGNTPETMRGAARAMLFLSVVGMVLFAVFAGARSPGVALTVAILGTLAFSMGNSAEIKGLQRRIEGLQPSGADRDDGET